MNRTPAQLRREYVVAAHFDKVRGRALYETALKDAWLNIMYQSKPNLAPATARKALDEMWRRYQQEARDPGGLNAGLRSDLELKMSVFEVASKIPGAGLGPSFFKELERRWQNQLLAELNEEERLSLENKFGSDSAGFDDKIADDLVQYAADAEKNEKYREARQQLIGAETGVPLTASIERLRQSTPALKALDEVRDLATATGALRTDVGKLMTLAERQFASLNKQLADVRKTVKELAVGQEEILRFVRSEERRREAERKAAEAAARYQLGLDGSRASVYLLSTLIGFADKKLGQQVATIGNAAITVVDSVVKYAQVIPKLVQTGAVVGQAFASAVLTGNIVNAVLSVVSLFTDAGPTPEQQILNEVKALRDDLGKFRGEVLERFDRVDRSLMTIYDGMMAGFAQINATTGRIEGGVTRLTEKLVVLQARLDRFEANVYELLFDLANRSLRLELARALGFKDTGQTMSFDRYFDHAKFFRDWSTQFAFEAPATGPASHSLEPDDVVLELAGPDRLELGPLDRKLNYLADYAARHWPDVPPFRRAPKLPSPTQWALGARAFAALALDWPEHAARIPASDTDEIERVGQGLRDDLASISRNRKLYQRAFENHRDALPAVIEWIEAIERKAITDLGLDPFGGAFQAIAKTDDEPAPSFAAMPSCDGTPGTLEPPHRQGALALMPAPDRVARYLAKVNNAPLPARSLTLCWIAEWTATGESEDPTLGTCTFGTPVMRVRLLEDGRHIRTRSVTGTPWRGCSGPVEENPPPPLPEIGPHVLFHWPDSMRARFDISTAPPEFEDEAHISARGTEVERAHLVPEQSRLYAQIAHALSRTTRGEAPRRLTGAALLIDAFVSLGFPRAFESDELMKALLRGDQGVLAEQTLIELYVGATTKPPARNLRLDLPAIGAERLDTLRKAVFTYIELIETRRWHESHQLIEIALARLRMAESAARPADRTPALLVPTIAPGQRIPGVITTGLRIGARCSEACEAKFMLRLRAPAARALGLTVAAGAQWLVVGSLTRQLPAAPGSVVLPFTPAARARLVQANTLTLTLRTRTQDRAGNTAVRDTQLVLRR